jgi:hypothetical protein
VNKIGPKLSFNMKDSYVLLSFSIFTWTIFFGQNILGDVYTGWDTHDLGFTFFTYFSDALHTGNVPFWNPLIQGGTFHAGLFNAGNYSPFQWIFLLISQIFNPVYVYELMIQVVIMLGSLGFYLWLRSTGASKLISVFGAQAYFLSVLMPLVGQVMFLFSLTAFPWMLFVCNKAVSENKEKDWAVYFLWAALISSFMSSGYPWMNVVNFVISFLYGCNLYCVSSRTNIYESRAGIDPAIVNLIIFFFFSILVLACYYIPGYYSLKFYYHLFAGDYISPEPRLRGLTTSAIYSYRGISDAFFASIDPRILKNNDLATTNFPVWTWGVGWVVWLTLFYKKIEEGFISKNRLWIGLTIFWLLYSAGTISSFVMHLPLLNANRWCWIGLVYVSICLIVMVVSRLKHTENINGFKENNRVTLFVGSILSFAVIVFFSAPLYEYIMVAIVTLIIYYLIVIPDSSRWRTGIVLLILINMIAFILMPLSMPGATLSQQKLINDPAQNYHHQIQLRNKSTVVLNNYRRLGQAKEYLFNDEEWLISKIPFSHGYNPLGNPLYWYLKDESFLQNVIYMTQKVRLEKKISRADFPSDKAFASALVQDVKANIDIPTVDVIHSPELEKGKGFKWQLKDFRLEPNQASTKVMTNGAGYLIFNNTYFPGWEVIVDGKKAEMVSVNRIFQGVYLNAAGEFNVTFQFYPILLISILIFPALLLLCGLMLVFLRSESNFIRCDSC